MMLAGFLVLICCLAPVLSNSTSMTCPARCTCRKDSRGTSIDCSGLGLTSVPDLSTCNGVCFELNLQDNQIASLPAKAFKGTGLQRLVLVGNPLTQINPDAFYDLENSLMYLMLEVKKDSDLALPSKLSSLINLKSLYISGFKITNLRNGELPASNSLTHLTLESCAIGAIDSDAFAPFLTSIQVLELKNDQLDIVPVHAIWRLKSLSKFSLTNNKIRTLESHSFAYLASLRELDLSHNNIGNIEKEAFYGLDKLAYLGLHVNAITGYSLAALATLTGLEQLNLALNSIKELTDYAFQKLNKLAYLNLQDNRIASITSKKFSGLENSLKVLILSDNPMKSIGDKVFKNLQGLSSLHLNGLHIGGKLSETTFDGLEEKLNNLYMDGIHFTSSDWTSIKKLKNLLGLSLCNNHILKIPDYAFSTMNKLVTLSLCDNHLQNVSQGSFMGLQDSLKTLDLSGNQIHSMTSCTFHQFKTLKEVRLEYNPLDCTCKLSWLRRWVEELDDASKMSIDWACGAPSALYNRLFRNIPHVEFLCLNNQFEPTEICKDTSYGVGAASNSTSLANAYDEVREPQIYIDFTDISATSITMTWSLQVGAVYHGFKVFYRLKIEKHFKESLQIHRTVHKYVVKQLKPGQNYTVCVEVETVHGGYLDGKNCKTIRTKLLAAVTKEALAEPELSDMVMLIGSIIGGIMFLILVMLLAIFIIKYRKRQFEKHARLPIRIEPRVNKRFSLQRSRPNSEDLEQILDQSDSKSGNRAFVSLDNLLRDLEKAKYGTTNTLPSRRPNSTMTASGARGIQDPLPALPGDRISTVSGAIDDQNRASNRTVSSRLTCSDIYGDHHYYEIGENKLIDLEHPVDVDDEVAQFCRHGHYGSKRPPQSNYGQLPYFANQNRDISFGSGYGQATPYSESPYSESPYGQSPYGQSPYGQSQYPQSQYDQTPRYVHSPTQETLKYDRYDSQSSVVSDPFVISDEIII